MAADDSQGEIVRPVSEIPDDEHEAQLAGVLSPFELMWGWLLEVFSAPRKERC